MSKKKLSIFFRNGSKPVPRALRMMQVANDLGYDAVFCGAIRENDTDIEGKWGGFDLFRVGEKYPLLNGKGLLTYFKFTIKFCIALYRFFKSKKPDLLVASDFEVMIPAIIYSKIYNVRLIYNIHDNLAQRYNIPPLVALILNTLEGIAVLLSESSLVPEDFRRDLLPSWCRKKISIVKNTPGDIKFSKPEFNDDKIRLFYGGWLNWGRGIKELIEIAKSNPKIKLVIAGPGNQEIISYISKYPFITYLGYLTHEQSLEQTSKAHFIPSFYNPNTLINLYAASNKLAESLAVGRPLLLNSEMKIIKSFQEYDCIIKTEYKSIDSLGDRLLELTNDKDKYFQMCSDSRRIFEDKYSWSEARTEMVNLINCKN
jgi:glycosyltransferase involved in cell wall biosynthesis